MWQTSTSTTSTSKSKQSESFKIQQSKTALICVKYITLKNKNSNNLIITSTMEGPVQIFQFVQKQKFKNYASFHPLHPISTFYYDSFKNLLYCGDICGSVITFSFQKKSLLETQFQYMNKQFRHKAKQKQPIIMIHRHASKLYLVNLKNQLKILQGNTAMGLQSKVQFKNNISAVCMFQESQELLLAVAFNNKNPPFVYNCHSQIQYQKATQKLEQNYQNDQEKIDQIIFMQYIGKPVKKIVCADSKNCISVYGFQKINLLCYQSQILWKFDTGQQILDMQVKNQYIYYTQWAKFEVINILQKKKLYNYTKGAGLRWGIFLEIDKKKQVSKNDIILYTLARGYNPNRQDSKLGTPNFHLLKGNIQ